jgi:hypothetical protein
VSEFNRESFLTFGKLDLSDLINLILCANVASFQKQKAAILE